jgi:hypothetical protein
VLSADLADDGLKAGDVGTVVMVHRGGKGLEVEFVALDGETIAVTTVDADQLRRVRKHEIAHSRHVELPLAAYGGHGYRLVKAFHSSIPKIHL